MWGNKHLKNSTKISVYRAAVLTALLYGSESWVTYRCQLRLLERFHQRCLRTILNIHWSEFVTNVEVLEQAKLTSIEAMLLKSQLRWVGHVSRMEDHRLPKIALYGELSSGHRNIGAPKKRYKDTLKRLLVPATLTITSGRHSLQTVTYGVKPSTRPCPLSKKTAWTASRRNGTGGRHVWLRFQSKTRPSPATTATTATGHASPASAFSATSVPAGDVDDPLLNLRSRSHAMMMTYTRCR